MYQNAFTLKNFDAGNYVEKDLQVNSTTHCVDGEIQSVSMMNYTEADWWEVFPILEPQEKRMVPMRFCNAGQLPFLPIDESDWEMEDE